MYRSLTGIHVAIVHLGFEIANLAHYIEEQAGRAFKFKHFLICSQPVQPNKKIHVKSKKYSNNYDIRKTVPMHK